jgi:hypothetical protein
MCRHTALGSSGVYSGPEGIEMDIADQILEIGVLLADNRFITVLKKMTRPVSPAIEGYCIAGKKSCHDRGQGHVTRTDEEMHVVGEKRPCVAGSAGLREERAAPFDEVASIRPTRE